MVTLESVRLKILTITKTFLLTFVTGSLSECTPAPHRNPSKHQLWIFGKLWNIMNIPALVLNGEMALGEAHTSGL